MLFSLFVIQSTAFAKGENNMDKSSAIRLIYPQWQGGNIAGLIPELDANDASRGYILGAYMLNF